MIEFQVAGCPNVVGTPVACRRLRVCGSGPAPMSTNLESEAVRLAAVASTVSETPVVSSDVVLTDVGGAADADS